MTITVRLFASLRERAGCSAVTRKVAEGATAGDLMSALYADFPALKGSGRVAIAVNSEYTDAGHRLRDGDEVALIPPVSGGSDRAPGRDDAAESAAALDPATAPEARG
jgi:molybdopterin converting factor subunit 1